MSNSEMFFTKAKDGLAAERSVQIKVHTHDKGISRDGEILEITPSTSQGVHETQRIFVSLCDLSGVAIS